MALTKTQTTMLTIYAYGSWSVRPKSYIRLGVISLHGKVKMM